MIMNVVDMLLADYGYDCGYDYQEETSLLE